MSKAEPSDSRFPVLPETVLPRCGCPPRSPVTYQPPQRSPIGVRSVVSLEMRRGGSLSTPPRHTGYPWEALQGSVVAATLLGRAGFDAWNWGDQAIRRAVGFLERLDSRWGGWWAKGDDTWQLFLINRAYGTRFATDPHATFGKNVGWTAWTHSAKAQTRVARRR